jgi:predicted RNase H-like HicB family nuclease
MEYIALLQKERKSDYGVSFPDFPGCVTAGKTLEEASRNAQEALALHIAGMREDGERIPEPSVLDFLARRPKGISDAVPFLVNVRPERTVRINITARTTQVAEIDRRANLSGMTRSAYLVHECTKPNARFKKAHMQTRRARRAHLPNR